MSGKYFSKELESQNIRCAKIQPMTSNSLQLSPTNYALKPLRSGRDILTQTKQYLLCSVPPLLIIVVPHIYLCIIYF